MNRRTLSGLVFALGLGACLVVAVMAAARALQRAELHASSAPVRVVNAPIPASGPILAESEVFRTHAGVTAIPPGARRTRDAHTRTLARFRLLRAYPGAPPRIPHGFTADEFRTGACTTCHQRGGYSPRFDAYVPVTPHPEMPACLQCHVGRDEVTGVSLPDLDPSTICRQCHVPGAARLTEGLVDWRPLPWKAPAVASGFPPLIPHDSFFRGNCLACHSGPSAVAEIRTDHPDRYDCRGCHVAADPAEGGFVRTVLGEAR